MDKRSFLYSLMKNKVHIWICGGMYVITINMCRYFSQLGDGWSTPDWLRMYFLQKINKFLQFVHWTHIVNIMTMYVPYLCWCLSFSLRSELKLISKWAFSHKSLTILFCCCCCSVCGTNYLRAFFYSPPANEKCLQFSFSLHTHSLLNYPNGPFLTRHIRQTSSWIGGS